MNSKTTYKVLKRSDDKTQVLATLHTGKTHQLRLHFASMEHPIIGDELYGNKTNDKMCIRDRNTDPKKDIKNYYFFEYIVGYDSIEDLKATKYETIFSGVVTYRVDFKYNVYKACLLYTSFLYNKT